MGYVDNFPVMKSWVLILILTLPSTASQAPCGRGWFGQNCQYKCHRTNIGDCTGNCVPGWFGPDCQYADLMRTNATASTPQVLRDGDQNTCITDQNLQFVTLSLTQAFPFTWMRLQIRNNDLNLLLGLNVQLQVSSGVSITCGNMKKIPFNGELLDVYCDGDVAVQSVILTGDGVKSLCTVNFNGGRNIALTETARQSGDYTDSSYRYVAALAVDGNTAQDFDQKSCTATSPTWYFDRVWRVDLSQPRMVNRYVVYNRQDCCGYRLIGFTLTSYAADNRTVFTHQDQETDPQAVYTVTSAGIPTPVSYVVISAKSNVDVLTLCEVEIYGDSTCDNGIYGRDCGDNCSSSCETTENICEVSTGVCSQCQPGMTGFNCGLACPTTYHGSHCQERCSTNCVNQICDRVTGFCVNCPPGKQGNLCDQDCPPSKYGVLCLMTCSNNCLDQLCDRVTGECDNCIIGKSGALCDQDCPARGYGAGCTFSCSTNCTDQLCDPVSGNCNSCPIGKMGDLCDADCDLGTYGSDCSLSCNNCKNVKCDPINGSCTEGCKDGYKGLTCERVCELGRYGPGCNVNCSIFCNSNAESDVSPCHHVTGSCIYGCQGGYTGTRCDDADTELSVGAGVGIGLGVAAVIALVGVAIYILYRYRKRSSVTLPTNVKRLETAGHSDQPELFRADDSNPPTDMASSTTTSHSPPDNTTQDTDEYLMPMKDNLLICENLDEMAAKLHKKDKSLNLGEENDAGYANL